MAKVAPLVAGLLSASPVWARHAWRRRTGRVAIVAIYCLVMLGSRSTADADELVNVDGKVRVTFSGFVFNRRTATFDTVATVRNISRETLPVPIRLVVTGIAPASTTLVNATGQTVDGKPFVTVPAPATGLRAG